jgi:hypothetical protein
MLLENEKSRQLRAVVIQVHGDCQTANADLSKYTKLNGRKCTDNYYSYY